jgi:hypothetical protein
MVMKYMMGRACDGLVRMVLALIRYCKFMIRVFRYFNPWLSLLGRSIVSLPRLSLRYLVEAQGFPVVPG